MKEKTKGVGIIVTLWEGCWRKIIYDEHLDISDRF